MAIALVSSVALTPGSGGSTSSAINTTGSSLLVMVVSQYAPSGTAPVSDSYSNTWTPLTSQGLGIARETLYYAENPTVGTGHTFTVSGTAIFQSSFAAAFSGTATTSVLDSQNGATTAPTGTTLSTGNVTPAADGALLVSGLSTSDGTTGLNVSSPWTTLYAQDHIPSTAEGGAIGYYFQTTAAAIAATWNWTGTASGGATTIGAFKAAGGAPPTGKLFRPSLLVGLGAGGPFFQNPLG